MRSIDLLYLHPPNHGPFPYFLLPVGVAGMMNTLRKKGVNVLGLNLGLQAYIQRRFPKKMLFTLPEPRVIALDIHWYEHLAGALDTIRLLKKHWLNTQIIVGGLTASDFSEALLRDCSGIDYIVQHAAEEAFPRLVQSLLDDSSHQPMPNVWQRDGTNILPPSSYDFPNTLDDYNYADFSFLKDEKEYLSLAAPQFSPHFTTLYVARGCPLSCTFCEAAREQQAMIYTKHRTLRRKPESVVQEIAALYKKGVRRFKPNFDLCLLGQNYWENFFQSLSQLPFRIGLLHEFWHLPSHTFLQTMADSVDPSLSSCIFSPMSPNDKVRVASGKKYTNEALLHTLRAVRRCKLAAELAFASALPGETNQSFKEIDALVKEAVQILFPQRLALSCYPILPDPGARIWENYPLSSPYEFYKRFSQKPSLSLLFRKKLGLIPLGYSQPGASLLFMQGFFLKVLMWTRLAYRLPSIYLPSALCYQG